MYSIQCDQKVSHFETFGSEKSVQMRTGVILTLNIGQDETNGVHAPIDEAEQVNNTIPNYPNNTGEHNAMDDETRRQLMFFLGRTQALLGQTRAYLEIIQRLLEVWQFFNFLK